MSLQKQEDFLQLLKKELSTLELMLSKARGKKNQASIAARIRRKREYIETISNQIKAKKAAMQYSHQKPERQARAEDVQKAAMENMQRERERQESAAKHRAFFEVCTHNLPQATLQRLVRESINRVHGKAPKPVTWLGKLRAWLRLPGNHLAEL